MPGEVHFLHVPVGILNALFSVHKECKWETDEHLMKKYADAQWMFVFMWLWGNTATPTLKSLLLK